MDTGIYIRAIIGGKIESIDIGDRRLNADQLLRWLNELSEEGLARTMAAVKAAIEENAATPD